MTRCYICDKQLGINHGEEPVCQECVDNSRLEWELNDEDFELMRGAAHAKDFISKG